MITNAVEVVKEIVVGDLTDWIVLDDVVMVMVIQVCVMMRKAEEREQTSQRHHAFLLNRFLQHNWG